MTTEIRRYATAAELGEAAAAYFAEAAGAAVAERGRFCAALAGGRTPVLLYGALRRLPWLEAVPWTHVHLFWGDERCVPSGHPESNYGLARRELLDRVPIPAENFHHTPVESGTPAQAAAAWEAALHAFFGSGTGKDEFPAFDLVILGMGADGHTASLFPGDAALEEKKRWVMPVSARGEPAVARLTLTLPVFNHARRALILVAGADKRETFEAATARRESAQDAYPAARIRPRGTLSWFFTEASA
ncbi:MAG: 6-phosphogluconolactonase [Betaproteobacteria bacterium]|nr:6-phosphogluconolactonase [Betaproteobacteria bacterium]